MYIRSLNPRNFAELAQAVPIDCTQSHYNFRSTCVPTRLITNKSETRYYLPISSPGIQKLDFISKVMMVTRCLSNVDNTTLQDLCENAEVYNTVESLLPVTDTLLNYRNRYCAYCNWITDDVLTDWTLELYCDVDLSFTKQIVDAVKRRMCNVFFNPPENIAVSECYIDTRNDTNPGCITTVQGTFISDNDTYDRLCFPGQDRSFDVISQHQYMCFSCEADHGPLIGEFDVGCVLRNFDIIDDLSPPFTAILDPNVLHSMTDDANTDQVTCDPATQFEDLRMVIPWPIINLTQISPASLYRTNANSANPE